MKYVASNYGSIGTLDNAINSSATEFDVTGSSAKLADLASGEGYLLCLGDPAGTREFIRCSTFSANHFAGVTRGFESSKNGGAARSWPSGTPVAMIISAAYLDNIAQFSDIISEAEAEAGTATTGWLWSALRVKQAITGGYDSAKTGNDWFITLPTFLGGWKLKMGSVAFSSGSNTTSVSVTFSGSAFTSQPLVIGNSDSGSGLIFEATTRTVTGATISLSQRESSAFSAGNALYFAIGK
jgi:hypothetical protein